MTIEANSEEMECVVSLEQEITELGSGFGGGRWPCEGPLWYKDEGHLLFSDIENNKRMKWSPSSGISLDFEHSNQMCLKISLNYTSKFVHAKRDLQILSGLRTGDI